MKSDIFDICVKKCECRRWGTCLQRVKVPGGAQSGDQRVVRVVVARVVVDLCVRGRMGRCVVGR